VSAAALVVLLALGGAPSSVEVEASFVYGFGARQAFGGAAVGTAGWPVWASPGATGVLEAGVWAGYQNEPYALTAAYLAPSVVTGSSHRVEVFALVGHQVQLLESRRLQVGLQLFAGWTWLALRGQVVSAEQAISRSTSADASQFTFGLVVPLGFRLTQRVSVVARFLLPVPWAGLGVSSYFLASLGLSVGL
jgi:hypothetical protein